jgi:hypothetical protein
MKINVPEPGYPSLPFSVNVKPHIELVAQGSALMVVFDGVETPLHAGASRWQADEAWRAWDSDADQRFWLRTDPYTRWRVGY